MNAFNVIDVLNQIDATKSRIEKEEILSKALDDEFMRKVLTWAYDPFITYGVTPPKVESEGKIGFDINSRMTWVMLESLRARTLSGNKAKEFVLEHMNMLTPTGADLLWRILSKDMRCGITEKTINALMPGTIPTFTVMLAHKFEPKRITEWPVIVEPKLDGVRVICLVKAGSARFFSRTGKPFPALDHLSDDVVKMVRKAVAELTDKVPTDKLREVYRKVMENETLALDGEMVSGSFNETSGAVRRKSEAALDAEFHMFDVAPYALLTGSATEFKASYAIRRELLRYIVDRAPTDKLKKTERYFANSADEVQSWYQKFRDRGLEGAIVKPTKGIYVKRRSYDWLKMKNESTEDLRVVGAFEGSGKYEGMLGGLIVQREHNGAMVEVRVGGGFSDAQRAEFWEAYKLDLGRLDGHEDAQPYEFHALGCEVLDRLIEVEYHEVTPDGSLRHPRFLRWRDDKDEKLKVAA